MAIDLAHDIAGPAEGPAVLFVHGILSCRAHWTLNLPAFHEVGYRTAVVELLGHGRSPAPDDLALYHPDVYAERFSALRESLGAEHWFVVAQSLGAGISLHYAMSRPEEIVAHVVTNSHSAFGDPIRMRNPQAAQDRAQSMVDGGIEAVMAHPLNPRRARAFSEAQQAQFADDMRRSTPLGIARTMLHTSPHTSMRDRLPSNTVPTLLIAGDREAAFTPAREWVEQHAANFRVERVSATHAVNISAAHDFNRLALAFFSEFAPSDS